VIERRFTDAFQAVEKRVINDDRAHLQQLAGVSPFACWRESLRQPNQWEKKPSRYSRPDPESGRMTLSRWRSYLGFTWPSDAMPMRCAFLKQAADTISIEKDALAGPIFQIGSRKSRHVRAHLRKPLTGFDICSQSRRAVQCPSLL